MRLHLIVSGRVQGVCYRWFCRESADSCGITGWARNMADGTVELEAQGGQGALDQFVAALEGGPSLARVDGIQKNAIPVIAAESEFGIRY